jgi:CBS domain-containing protein
VSQADIPVRLRSIAEQLRKGDTPERITVRSLLRWFGVYRRGYYKVERIRRALEGFGLRTEPDFESAWIDKELTFALAQIAGDGNVDTPPPQVDATGIVVPPSILPAPTSTDLAPSTVTLLSGGVADPTYRIGKLAAANRIPLTVTPETSLQEAVTLMLSHDYSQLPVMQGERTVKGVISWTTIGSRLVLRSSGAHVLDFMDKAREVSADTSLFAAIGAIVGNQYVLVRDRENRVSGIVTTSDLSLQFQQLAEPFLLLGEIENHIRRLIDGKFTADEVRAVRDPGDERVVQSVADLTFGEYQRMLEHPDRWSKLRLNIERASFIQQLDRVREIRNEVMHFDPDGTADEDLLTLRRFVRFLQMLQEIGAT